MALKQQLQPAARDVFTTDFSMDNSLFSGLRLSGAAASHHRGRGQPTNVSACSVRLGYKFHEL